MYQLIGIKSALKLYAFACGIIIVAWALLFPPAQALEWWKIVSGSVTAVALLVWVLGETAIFPYLCRLPVVRSYFPDIDGEWRGEIKSNWALVAQRSRPKAAAEIQAEPPRTAIVAIKSRLFFIRIDLDTMPRYSVSKTILVQATRDAQSGKVRLYYVYDDEVKTPQPADRSKHSGDSSQHFGAAHLDVEHDDGGELRLEVAYWTNRNRQNAENTAGRITLRRVAGGYRKSNRAA
jgi:SMODS-associating 2TM, beta-strand rich effector domain